MALSGAIAGFANTYIIGPVELVKIKMQMQKNTRVYSGPLHCAASIVRQSGVRGLFQGGFATIWAEFPAYANQFLIYEACKRHVFAPGTALGPEGSVEGKAPNLSGWRALVAGGISGYFCWLTCFPADIIKTKIQYKDKGHYPRFLFDGGFWHVGREIIRQDGFLGLFRGFSAISGRAFLSNAVGFWLWELSRAQLQLKF